MKPTTRLRLILNKAKHYSEPEFFQTDWSFRKYNRFIKVWMGHVIKGTGYARLSEPGGPWVIEKHSTK